MRKKLSGPLNIGFIVAFCALLLFYPLMSLLPGHNDNTENKTLFQFPKITKENVLQVPSYFDTYLDDHVPFKSAITRMRSRLIVQGLNTSTGNTVILGKNGFLFYDSKYDGGSDTMADYAATNHYSQEQMAFYAGRLEALRQICAERGVPFYLMICPNKESVYSENMPDYVNRHDGLTRADVFVDYLRTHTAIEVIYPKDALVAAKANNMLYYRNDTHWNEIGGFIGARCLLNATLGIPMPEQPYIMATEEVVLESPYVFGDLANTLSLRSVLPDLFYRPIGNFPVFSMDGIIGDYFYDSHLVSTGNQGNASIMMVRDSFFTAVHAYMAGYFSRGDFFWYTPDALPQALEQMSALQPDIFVYEVVERNLDHMLNGMIF